MKKIIIFSWVILILFFSILFAKEKFVVSINFSDDFAKFRKDLIRAIRVLPDEVIIKNVSDFKKAKDWIEKISGEEPAELELNVIPQLYGGVYNISYSCFFNNTCILNIYTSFIGGDKTEMSYSRIREFEEVADDIYKKYFSLSSDVVTKERKIYSWIIENVMPDKNDILTARNSGYSALVWGKSLCDGYASLLNLLLQKSGIPSKLVTGKVVDLNGNFQGHAWNSAKICGSWYYLDSIFDENFYPDFKFFNVSTDFMENNKFSKHICITNCVNANNWNGETCEIKGCSVETPNECDEFSCYKMGWYWNGKSCQKEPFLPKNITVISWDNEHIYFAHDEDSCLKAEGFWYNGICNKTPIVECGDNTTCILASPPEILSAKREDIFIDPVKNRVEILPEKGIVLPALTVDFFEDVYKPFVYIYFPEKKWGGWLDNFEYEIENDVIFYNLGQIDFSKYKGLRIYIYIGYYSVFGNIFYNGYELYVKKEAK